MNVEIDSRAFERGLHRLAEEVQNAAEQAAEAGLGAIEDQFRSLAVVESGEYRDSWVTLPPKRSRQAVEAAGGPSVPYARRLEKRYGAVRAAVDRSSSAVQREVADEWRKAVR